MLSKCFLLRPFIFLYKYEIPLPTVKQTQNRRNRITANNFAQSNMVASLIPNILISFFLVSSICYRPFGICVFYGTDKKFFQR